MAKIDLGKIAVTPEGIWSADRPYERLSLVVHEGLPYISLHDSIGKNPKLHSDDWMPLLTEELNKTYIDTELAKKQDKITSLNKLPYNLISGTPTIPDISGKADKTYVDKKISEIDIDIEFATDHDIDTLFEASSDFSNSFSDDSGSGE